MNLHDAHVIAAERDDLECYIWDAYRDAHGIRPRFMRFSAMSIEELRQEARDLSDEVGRQIAREAQLAFNRGVEQCFALHHPNGHIFLDGYWAEEELKHHHGGDMVKALKNWEFSEYYVADTAIYVNVAPKVTLLDVMSLRRAS